MTHIDAVTPRTEDDSRSGQCDVAGRCTPYGRRVYREGEPTPDASPVLVTDSPVLDERRDVVGMISVWTDTTAKSAETADAPRTDHDVIGEPGTVRERQELEHHLHQAQRLENLGQLAGGIAHDINNLLTVIITCASLVGRTSVLDDHAQEDLERITHAGTRAATLVQQLMAFGRSEAVRPQTVQLNDVAASVQRMLSRTLGEHIDLSMSLDADLSCVHADRAQLELVLVNLVVNASHAMPGGGRLMVDTRNVTLPAGDACADKGLASGRYVRVAVTDDGCGMSADVAARAFEPFFTTKPRGAGSGLGLATVYEVVREAGGDVRVCSEVGEGTRIEIHLPATDRQLPSADHPAALAAPRGAGELIIVVEDEDEVRSLTCRLLERNGYRVMSARGGSEALHYLEHAEADVRLLITDVVMPTMSGSDLAESVRRILPDIQVLFVSGYSAGARTPQVFPDEGAPLLEKPFGEAHLLRRVASLMSASVATAPEDGR